MFEQSYSDYLNEVEKWRIQYNFDQIIRSQTPKIARSLNKLVYLLRKRIRNLNGYWNTLGDRKIINGRQESVFEREARIGRKKSGNAVRSMVKNGALPSLKDNYINCVDCGERATDYEHRDYNKPREVEPVCRKCNLKRGSAIYLETMCGSR